MERAEAEVSFKVHRGSTAEAPRTDVIHMPSEFNPCLIGLNTEGESPILCNALILEYVLSMDLFDCYVDEATHMRIAHDD